VNTEEFIKMQKLPYEEKAQHALNRAREFYEHCEGNVFASLGGIDSATLTLMLWKHIDRDIPAVTVHSLEEKSVQSMHDKLRDIGPVIYLTPLKSKVEVIREYGYPILSKDKAGKIQMLQKPPIKNATVRHAIVTGETGKYGGFKTIKTGSHMRLPQIWLDLFGGPENTKYGTNYKTAPFKVSNKCCEWMKERPCNQYAKETGRNPYEGLMASEGGQREKVLMKTGCNYYGKTVTRSCPFAIFSRQDILQLALDMKTPVPTIYGEIKRDPITGLLETTRAKRTGCNMCGFGIHIEPRPHRFDRLRHDNLKEWQFWMYEMGWGKVLDYIGVEWEEEVEVQGKLELVEAL
jgi:3'-phosphoadenosine 5'-phosphosulfate sulfotransferase (PAPS reductase)/FAD synthetase